MEGYSAAQVREAERPLLAAGEPLMARAAAALARECDGLLADRLGGSPRLAVDTAGSPGPRRPARILVLAGSGNNGGDALYAAAELQAAGDDVLVLGLGRHVHEEALAAAAVAGARPLDAHALAEAARGCDLIVDGILGTGAGLDPERSAAVRSAARDAVLAVLALPGSERPPVVAVDLPSGLHPDDGGSDGVVLPAELTVTFGAAKAGLLRGDGPGLSGRIVLVDIGLCPELAGVRPLVRDDRGGDGGAVETDGAVGTSGAGDAGSSRTDAAESGRSGPAAAD